VDANSDRGNPHIVPRSGAPCFSFATPCAAGDADMCNVCMSPGCLHRVRTKEVFSRNARRGRKRREGAETRN